MPNLCTQIWALAQISNLVLINLQEQNKSKHKRWTVTTIFKLHFGWFLYFVSDAELIPSNIHSIKINTYLMNTKAPLKVVTLLY